MSTAIATSLAADQPPLVKKAAGQAAGKTRPVRAQTQASRTSSRRSCSASRARCANCRPKVQMQTLRSALLSIAAQLREATAAAVVGWAGWWAACPASGLGVSKPWAAKSAATSGAGAAALAGGAAMAEPLPAISLPENKTANPGSGACSAKNYTKTKTLAGWLLSAAAEDMPAGKYETIGRPNTTKPQRWRFAC